MNCILWFGVHLLVEVLNARVLTLWVTELLSYGSENMFGKGVAYSVMYFMKLLMGLFAVY